MARSYLVPGFRFRPTDVELVMYHLKRKLLGNEIILDVVAEVNIYDFCPWDLPDKSALKSGDLEWYFFCPNAKKYTTGSRLNRSTKAGFWKPTGRDREVKYEERTVAKIKTLIFHNRRTEKGQRTNWVMHEYRMADEQLAEAGVVQDTYMLCRIFQKSGLGPKNGAEYGAPFNEKEWDDDLASSSGSQAIVCPVGASNSTDYKQKGPATTSMTGPGSSTVTYSANEPANTKNFKQKDPATTSMTGPGASMLTFSANEPTNTQNLKRKGPATSNLTGPGSPDATFSVNEPTNTLKYGRKGPATMNLTGPGSSVVRFSANEPTNALNYKQKGPATTNMTEPGSSVVPFSAKETTNTLNYTQKGPATMNMSVPQITHGLSLPKPVSSNVLLSTNEMPANDDMICLEDIMGDHEDAANREKVETVGNDEDDGIMDELMYLLTNGHDDYTLDELLATP